MKMEQMPTYSTSIIRKATSEDYCRIAEIFVFNNRMYYMPIFKDEVFSFKELQVTSFIQEIENEEGYYVYDDGIIRGYMQVINHELHKLYVDPFFQNQEIGSKLMEYAIANMQIDYLWCIEANIKAIHFYQRHGFKCSDERVNLEGTSLYDIKMMKEG